MKLSEIAKVIAPETLITSDLDIQYLLTDSRQPLASPEKTLFFALHTEKNDGAKYIPDLIERGVRAFVVTSDWSDKSDWSDSATVFSVADTLAALQQLAAYKRSLFPHIPVIKSNIPFIWECCFGRG